jgi:hypothetical protein
MLLLVHSPHSKLEYSTPTEPASRHSSRFAIKLAPEQVGTELDCFQPFLRLTTHSALTLPNVLCPLNS